MHIVDRYAYSNHIRAVDPAHKSGIAMICVLLCLLLNRPLVSILTIGWSVVLAVGWARLPVSAFGRVLLAESVFLGLSVAGIALSFGIGSAPAGVLWQVQVGSVWLGSSPAALRTALHLVLRTLGCASALNLLIMTTPLVDLIELCRRLRLPALLIDLMTLIYTSIFVLLESVQRMYTAQDSRLGYGSVRRTFRSAALLGSRLFIDAYQRSQRMQMALDSRAYTGQLQVLPILYQRDHRAWWLGSTLTISLLVAWIST